MFTKIARLLRRRSMHIDVEPIQDAKEDVQIVDDDPQPQVERERVDTAPDLLRWCNLETPFPSVAFGGYIKYYAATKTFTEPDRLFNLPVTLPPLSDNIYPSPSPTESPESPTKTVREAESTKTTRKPRRYSLSSAFSISEKSPQLFRWKRATSIISSSIAEHDLSPLFSQSSSHPDTVRRPSFEMTRSLSSRGSSDSSSSPDSIAFEFRHDSDSTLPPNSPTSIYSNVEAEVHDEEEEDGVMVESPKSSKCSDSGTPSRSRSQRRSISWSSYKTALSQG